MGGNLDDEVERIEMDLSRKVAELVEPFIAGKNTVGLAVGLVYQGEYQAHCYGSIETGSSAPPDRKTTFEIGSITKVFTTTLLADMHLSGEVDLDDPASRYLPSSVAPLNLGGIDVTLRHLATHTSGLPRIPMNMGIRNLRSDNPYAKYTVEDLYEYLSKPRLASTPGVIYSYSNLGMGLLGHILGLLAGKEYEELVIERICRPLEMNDTAIALSDDQHERLAPGHNKGKRVSNWDIPTLPGCGAFRSTLHDKLTFLKANIHPESTPLGGAFELAQTIQPQRKEKKFWRSLGRSIWAGDRSQDWRSVLMWALIVFFCVSWLVFNDRNWMIMSAVLAAAEVFSIVVRFFLTYRSLREIGLGWHVESIDKDDGRIFWHNGGTGGYRSYMGFVEGRGIGVVLLSNSTVPPDPIGVRLLNTLATLEAKTS